MTLLLSIQGGTMIDTTRTFLIAGALLLYLASAIAQPPAEDPIEIPFRLVENVVWLQVRVNNSRRTAWLTARRRDGEAGHFDFGALMVPLAVGVVLVTYGLEAANSQTGSKGGYPAAAY